MTRQILFAAALLAAAGSAQGQSFGTAQFWWEASADGGATWARDVLEVGPGQESVRVRAWAAWQPGPGEGYYHYFGGVNCDVVVRGIDGAGASDSASDFARTRYLDVISHPIGASRFGAVLKIDDERDTLPPGEGTRWLHFSQPPENFSPGWVFQTQNPIMMFAFSLALDGSLGDRIVTQVLRPAPGTPPGDPPRYFLRTYITPGGLGNYPDGEGGVFDLRISVVPAPGAAGLLALGALLTRRGRRRC